MKPAPLLSLCCLLLAGSLASAGDACLSARDLSRLTQAELDDLFCRGSAEPAPQGVLRGKVLLVVDAACPRLRARLQNIVWKGKVLDCAGGMINRWCGFRAVEARWHLGHSCFDGKPCVVVDYEPDAPIFGNTRDEIRQIAPGLWLGRFYDRCPCMKLKGYFFLEARCDERPCR